MTVPVGAAGGAAPTRAADAAVIAPSGPVPPPASGAVLPPGVAGPVLPPAVAGPVLPPAAAGPVLPPAAALPPPPLGASSGAGTLAVPPPPSPLPPSLPVPTPVRLLPPPPFVPPRRGPTTRGTVALVGCLLAVVGLLGLSVVHLTTPTAPALPDHPTAWDARVVALVAFVERERGLAFRYPMYVDFRPVEHLDGAGSGALRPRDSAELQALATRASRLRALGLLGGTSDLTAPADDGDPFAGLRSLADYDPTTKRLSVAGGATGALDVGHQVALVHALVRALQDQQFDLVAAETAAPAPEVVRALADGDARRLVRRWIARLSDTEQAELAGGPAGVALLPPAGSGATTALAPLLAESVVDLLVDLGGTAELDQAFRHPALSDEALFDPGHYRGNGRVVPVTPRRPPGAVLDEGTLGPMVWYQALAEANDPATALRAAYGWGGDHYVLARSGDQTCLQVVFRGDRPDDVTEMRTALERWIATGGGARREVSVLGDQLVVVACDPGAAAVAPRAALDPGTLAAPRLVVELTVALHHDRSLPYQAARCVSMALLATWSPDELAARSVLRAEPAGGRLTDADRSRLNDAVAGCRHP